ncbi:Multidrug resistance protein MdtC [Trichinella spiralis]|uniref:Multidrug resistance protein MdtC n=1 Tax=Trichinella spiralis TaxID=6334 RepID=A0ABR3KDG7_TRISP
MWSCGDVRWTLWKSLEHPVATRVDTLTFHLPESVVPSTTWTVAVLDRKVHMEDNDMIDVYVFAEASEKE